MVDPSQVLALRPTLMDYNQLQAAFEQKQQAQAMEQQLRNVQIAEAQKKLTEAPSFGDAVNQAAFRLANGSATDQDHNILSVYQGIHPRSNISGIMGGQPQPAQIPQPNPAVDVSQNAQLAAMQAQMPPPGPASMKPPALPSGQSPGVIDLGTQDDSNDFKQNPMAGVNGSDKPAPQPLLTGSDYLKTLDPQMAAVVKLIGDGKEKSTALISRMKPDQKLQIMSSVAQYNPDYSANNITGQGKFTYGVTGDKIRSLNTSIAHINETLVPSIQALGNGDIKAFNKFAQYYAEQTGNPAPANFDAAKQIIAGEVVKAITASGGGVADREEAQASINRTNSPQQLMGVVGTLTSLLGGQLEGFKQQYKASTGRDDFDQQFLTEQTKTALEKTAPITVNSESEAMALPSGSKFILNGRKGTVR